MIITSFCSLSRNLSLIILLSVMVISEALAAKGGIPGAPPPNASQCKAGWSMLAGATDLAFGAFVVESGAGTLTMDNFSVVTAPVNISLLASIPTTTFTASLTNINTACGNDSFTINATIPDLAGPGLMPLTTLITVVDSLGNPLISNASPPQILSTTNLPISLIIHGGLTANPLAGAYTSAITVDFTDSVGTALSVGGAATATSVSPISLVETVPMDFGTVSGGSLAGTVTIDTLGGRTVTGGAEIITVGPGSAGEFEITGSASMSYLLTITGPAVLVSGANTMNAHTLTNNSTGILPAVTGIELFQVGATLDLAPLQAAGTYSTIGGTPYTVTVNYN